MEMNATQNTNPHGHVSTLVVDGKPMYEAAAISMLLAERFPEANLAPSVGDPSRATYLQWFFHLANTVQPALRLWYYPSDTPGSSFILGDCVSAVDIYTTMLMHWTQVMPKPATKWPRIAGLIDRVTSLPSWKQVNQVEGNAEWP
ncbi:hypothetical protein AC1031_002704 [Aphanomyces cochlioides]|nr:hypothetical protein AC1031_002704 [Aphanomyces cochlioides]